MTLLTLYVISLTITNLIKTVSKLINKRIFTKITHVMKTFNTTKSVVVYNINVRKCEFNREIAEQHSNYQIIKPLLEASNDRESRDTILIFISSRITNQIISAIKFGLIRFAIIHIQ